MCRWRVMLLDISQQCCFRVQMFRQNESLEVELPEAWFLLPVSNSCCLQPLTSLPPCCCCEWFARFLHQVHLGTIVCPHEYVLVDERLCRSGDTYVAERGPTLRVATRPMTRQLVTSHESVLHLLEAHPLCQPDNSMEVWAAISVQLLHDCHRLDKNATSHWHPRPASTRHGWGSGCQRRPATCLRLGFSTIG